ncbi:MAG: orotate phosphoribosyltransferase [Oscillospiraceae bacterium]|jgi:orotate phosphoribosyltransferase|nr:orotate phosphoribosyltransferase [Oscillospiraceae bacterium]
MDYRESFVRFMSECGALKFGEFKLKSGRIAPYFINTGSYNTGARLAKLGEYYADCIVKNAIEVQTVFGPAYKGIPLAVSCSIALAEKHGIQTNYAFDRKEAKDHGEGGEIVGKKLEDGEKTVITDDVITAGTAVNHVVPLLKSAADVEITGMVISVDRMEKGSDGKSAIAGIFENFGIKVYPIITVLDITAALESGVIPGKEYLPAMKEYLKKYGSKEI